MIIPFYEETLSKKTTVNLANTDNIELKNRGLKPLITEKYPKFFMPDGSIYYEMTRGSGKISDHYNANFKRDYRDCMDFINETNERDYINKTERFKLVDRNKSHLNELFENGLTIYDNKILYNSICVKEALSNIPDALTQIEQLLGEKLSIMDLSVDDIIFGDCFRNIDYRKTRQVEIKLTAIDRMQYIMKELLSHKYRFKDANCLQCLDVDIYLNYPCNLSYEYKLHQLYTGAYSNEALKIIKGLIASKMAVYDYFINLCEKSINPVDMLKSIKELYNITSFIDIVVMVLGFDKIESQVRNTITTSSPNIYERFFNYIIRDFNIVILPQLIPDYSKNEFKLVSHDDFIRTQRDHELEEEANYVKKLPWNERYRYQK